MRLRKWLPTVLMMLLVWGGRTGTAWAWGKEGHRIVAHIAELHLTPAATTGVNALLNGGATSNATVRLSDDSIANWADHVRHTWTNSAPWHYVDIPANAKAYDPIRDCTNHNGCVVEAIHFDTHRLADRQATDKQRLTSLKMLVHFVGDIHQPLHCAYRRFGENEDDRGGNLCVVGFLQATMVENLHVVWDSLLIERSLTEHHCDPIQYAELLNKQITPSREASWKSGTPEEWAWQSHRYAMVNAYAGIPTTGPMVTLDANYVRRNQLLVDRQLMRAGLRLARLLNDILKSP
jgi:hypothetical protein